MSVSEPARRDRQPYRPFAISAVRDGDRMQIVVAGELDLGSAGRLEEQVRLARASGAKDLVLDLADVDFIDSTGLRVLLSVRNGAVRSGHGLAVVPPRPAARRIFEITATRGLFDWRENPAAT